MAAKGRKGRVAALNATLPTVRPVRTVPPFTPLDSPDGATFRELDYYKILQPASPEEIHVWRAEVTHKLGIEVSNASAKPAGYLLGLLIKELPAVLTFLPTDPAEPWQTAAGWLATTKAPNYAAGRELDPEFAAEGGTPLLAALALLRKRIDGKIWAWSGALSAPRFYHYSTVYPNE